MTVRERLLTALIKNAQNFPSQNDQGEWVPASFMELVIMSEIGARYVEQKRVPADSEWDEFASNTAEIMKQAANAPKN